MGHSQKFEYTEKGNKPNKVHKKGLRAGAKGLLVSYGGYMSGVGDHWLSILRTHHTDPGIDKAIAKRVMLKNFLEFHKKLIKRCQLMLSDQLIPWAVITMAVIMILRTWVLAYHPAPILLSDLSPKPWDIAQRPHFSLSDM